CRCAATTACAASSAWCTPARSWESSLLSGAPLRVQAVAVTPAALVAVEREGLLALLASSPELALRWTGALSRRLLAYQERVLTLLHKDLARQVATVLLLEQE